MDSSENLDITSLSYVKQEKGKDEYSSYKPFLHLYYELPLWENNLPFNDFQTTESKQKHQAGWG